MSIIFQTYTGCQKFSFEESSNGELIEYTEGKVVKGTVILQKLENRGILRITLADVKNATKALAKDFFAVMNPLSNGDLDWKKVYKRYQSDDLNHFDFSVAELENGTKLIKVQGRYVNDKLLFMLLCYDFTTMNGRVYFFNDYNEIKKWSEYLDITEYEIADLESGKILDIESFEDETIRLEGERIHIIFQDKAIGARTKFIEEQGKFLHKQAGDTICGTLIYESLGGNKYRITFSDAQIMPAANPLGVWRGLFKSFSASPDNVCFEFTIDEVHKKTKQFTYWTANDGITNVYFIECYDLNTYRGSWYQFNDQATAEKWAKKLGVSKLKYYDENGNVEREERI